MLTSAIAVVALIVLVAPGFLVSRLASGRRAGMAGIGDLEMVVRALTYSLAIQAGLVLTGWTGTVISHVDKGQEWQSHRFEVVAYIAATFAAALAVGWVLGFWLKKLEAHGAGSSSDLATFAYHALGGQDARDAFDHLFQRRREEGTEFMVVVRTASRGPNDDGRHAGIYGTQSYFGLSPRPHDLLLQEMWKFGSNNTLKRLTPEHEGWFAADSILDLYLLRVPKEEVDEGRTGGLGSDALAEATMEGRADVVRDMYDHAPADPSIEALATAALRVIALAEQPEAAPNLRREITELGGLAARLVEEDVGGEGALIVDVARDSRQEDDCPPPWSAWTALVEQTLDSAVDEGEADSIERAYGLVRLAGLCVNALLQIDQASVERDHGD